MSVLYEEPQTHVQVNVRSRPCRKAGAELDGRCLILARLVRLIVTILAFGLFIAGIPLRYHELVTLAQQAERTLPHSVQGVGSLVPQWALSVNVYPICVVILEIALMIGFSASASLVYWRKSNDWRSMPGSIGLITFATYATGSLNALTKAHPLMQFPASCLQALGLGLTLIFFYILPDARFVPRWTLPLAAVWVIWTLAWLLFPGMPCNFSNLYTLPFSSFLVFMMWWGTGILAQYYRYRHLSTRRRQQQTRWVLLSLVAVIIGYAVYYLPRVIFPILNQPGAAHTLYMMLSEPLFVAFMLLIPPVFLFSILRYRLFGVDVIINRTLVYGTLTAVLVLVYASSVVLLQHLFQALTGQGSPLVIAGSTVAIALLFQPLRKYIQTSIDRHFYHYKYDAAQTLEAFGERLRRNDEVDLTILTNDVLEVVRETMQPTSVSLLLCEPVHQEEYPDYRVRQQLQSGELLAEQSFAGRPLTGLLQWLSPPHMKQGEQQSIHRGAEQPVGAQLHTTAGEGAAETRLRGYRLVAARIVWVILAVLTLAFFLAALPFRFAHLHVICADIMCGGTQETAEVADQLHSLGLTMRGYATYSVTVQVIFALVYFTIAVVIAWRKSDDRMALLVSLFLMTFALAFTDAPGVLARTFPAYKWPVSIVAFTGEMSFPLCFYLFPDGRFVPRWTRWLLVGWAIWGICTYFLADMPIKSSDYFTMLEVLAFAAGLGSIAIVQVYRYRYASSQVQRQQTKWVVFGMVAGVGGFFGAGFCGFIIPHVFFPALLAHANERTLTLIGITAITFTYLAMLLIPLSIGIAMLRYRLWDVDVLINRTLIYGALIGISGLVFIGSLIAQQQFLFALIGQASELFIAGSTLGIVALFQAHKPVHILAKASEKALSVCITDQGNNRLIPDETLPDLQAQLAEQQLPRDWGLFLMKNLVDDMHITQSETQHTVELIMYRVEDVI
jgi:hypothetical protein